jgi:hypothetical protein
MMATFDNLILCNEHLFEESVNSFKELVSVANAVVQTKFYSIMKISTEITTQSYLDNLEF